MMSPYLSILGFSLQAYPLLLLVAVWAGLWLAARQARRLGLEGDHVYNLGFFTLLAALLGARLAYVLGRQRRVQIGRPMAKHVGQPGFFTLLAALLGARLAYVLGHWSAYLGAPLSAFSPTPTALAWPEGLVAGAVVALIYWLRHRLPLGPTLDAVALGLALGLALERLGAFLDGRHFGEPTTLPWGIFMWGQVRHPVQLYEMAALLAILGILAWRWGQGAFAGYLFVLFVALYAGSRLLLEAFRAEAPLLSGGLRAAQLVALAVLLGAVWYLYRRRFAARQPVPLEDPHAGQADAGTPNLAP